MEFGFSSPGNLRKGVNMWAYCHPCCSAKVLRATCELWTVTFQTFKMVLEKAEEPEIKLPASLDHWKSRRVPEKHLFLPFNYAKTFDCVDHNKLWKILKEMGIPDHLTCILRNLYAGQMATHSSTLAWRIPWREEPGRLQSMELERVGHHWLTSLSLSGSNS